MASVTPSYQQGVQAFDVERQRQPYRAAAAPSGAYPEQSLPNAVNPTNTPSTHSYPTHRPEEQLCTPTYPQLGHAVPPAHAAGSTATATSAGYPQVAVGYPAAAVGNHGQQAAVVVTPGGVADSQTGNEPCQCSAGWVLFGIGWVFPICWLIGVFLPCCSKNRNDRRSAIGSGVMVAVTVIVLCIVVPLTVMAGAAASASQDVGQSKSYYLPGALRN